MDYEKDYRPSTRVGKFVWDIDVESMGVEELDALVEVAQHFKAKREQEESLMKILRRVLEKMEQAGYHLTYCGDDRWIDLNIADNNGALKLGEM